MSVGTGSVGKVRGGEEHAPSPDLTRLHASARIIESLLSDTNKSIGFDESTVVGWIGL